MRNRPYVDHGGEQVYAPPFIAEKVHFYGFVVSADAAILTSNVCDRYLNGPMSTRRFRPLTGHVLFVLNNIESMYARNPPYNAMGRYTEQEFATWMLVLDTHRLRIFWYHPYMIVDGAYAMAMGREIYGFPKMLGWFSGIHHGPNELEDAVVETVVTTHHGGEAEKKLLLRVRRTQVDANGAALSYNSLPELSSKLVESLGISIGDLDDEGAGAILMRDLIRLSMPFLFLRQFRDPGDPKTATFQSIQEASVQMTKMHSLRWYGSGYEIEIVDYFSHNIRKEFGLPRNPIPVEASFWALLDFEIGNGTEIWRAPI